MNNVSCLIHFRSLCYRLKGWVGRVGIWIGFMWVWATLGIENASKVSAVTQGSEAESIRVGHSTEKSHSAIRDGVSVIVTVGGQTRSELGSIRVGV